MPDIFDKYTGQGLIKLKVDLKQKKGDEDEEV